MRLGFAFTYSKLDLAAATATAKQLDALGYHSVWTGESYGPDALSPLAWMAAHTSRLRLGTAIMQIPARTPALTAMSAATLDELSGGRVLLGLGLSGPQVVEGWHGRPYGAPLTRTREYVQIVREVLRRERPLEFHGKEYDVPYLGEGSTGVGKALKSYLHPRADMPIYLAALGPKNVSLALEIADGLLPVLFSPSHWRDAYPADLEAKAHAGFDVVPTVSVAVGDDLEACRDALRPRLAHFVGGMGARGHNFYNDLVGRYGFEGPAKEIQDLYLDGRVAEAAGAVPDELVDEVALCGPRERIAERLDAWREAPITTLIVGSEQPEAVELMAELMA